MSEKRLSGLQRMCKLYGRMRCGDVLWLWDYAADEPVLAEDMPTGGERHKASERAKWTAMLDAATGGQANSGAK